MAIGGWHGNECFAVKDCVICGAEFKPKSGVHTVLEDQNGLCALSGIELTCKLEKGTKFLTNASIDRIEAGGPYIKENIQLVCTVLNKWRGDTDLQEYIWWYKKVAEYNGN